MAKKDNNKTNKKATNNEVTEDIKKSQGSCYFKLNQSKAVVWRSNDDSIQLTSAAATVDGIYRMYGSVALNDEQNYKQVKKAADNSILIKIDKKEYDSNKDNKTKLPVRKLNNVIERKYSMRRKAESLLKQEGDRGARNIINYVGNTADMTLLVTMHEIESSGLQRNDVVRAIESAMNKSKASGMSEIIDEGASNTYNFGPDQIQRHVKTNGDINN